MESSIINLKDYFNDNQYQDVFEELDSIRDNETRRLSFSIPDDSKKLQSASVQPSAPPSSPEVPSLTSGLSILLPEENDDVFFSLDNFNDIIESNPPSPNPIQDSINFPKESLLVFSNTDKTVYKMPSRKAYDARKIWRYAKISSISQIREIEIKLLDWAFTYANLKIINNKIESIIWKTHSGCFCSSKWVTFIKWILCASHSV